MKIVSKTEVEERIKIRFPNQPFEIIQYTKMTEPFIIKCLKCNQIKQFSSCRNFLNSGSHTRTNLCTCYNSNNTIEQHEINKKKILSFFDNNTNIKFLSFDYRERTKKHAINVLCCNCHQIFNKDWETFMNNQTCPYCFSKHNLNTLGFKTILPEEYKLIGEYKNNETKILIQHDCGFIWNIKPHNFIQKINSGYCGCPQCNHKRSKGELKIAKWLNDNNLIFIEEQTFIWSSNHKFRYDFYLPDNNLIIEYMGAQHYQEVEFFHDTLAQRQEYDRIKQQEALQHDINYLVIPYTEFKNIETILKDWFNDYSERKQRISD